MTHQAYFFSIGVFENTDNSGLIICVPTFVNRLVPLSRLNGIKYKILIVNSELESALRDGIYLLVTCVFIDFDNVLDEIRVDRYGLSVGISSKE